MIGSGKLLSGGYQSFGQRQFGNVAMAYNVEGIAENAENIEITAAFIFRDPASLWPRYARWSMESAGALSACFHSVSRMIAWRHDCFVHFHHV